MSDDYKTPSEPIDLGPPPPPDEQVYVAAKRVIAIYLKQQQPVCDNPDLAHAMAFLIIALKNKEGEQNATDTKQG